MIPGIDPKVDYAFKKLFAIQANVPLLLDLLNAVLRPSADHRIVDLEILNPFNEKDTLDGKRPILDIKARDPLGRQYNVEMEMCPSHVFPGRVLYYWAVLHGQQLREGERYTELRPTISISFVNGVLFPEASDYHLCFQLRSAKHPELVFSSHQSMHIVELPKFRRTAEELADSLEVWCYFLNHGDVLDSEHLPALLQSSTVPKALEVLIMLKQNELEWHRYQDRLKAERDHMQRMDDALENGELVGQIHACQRLLKVPLTARAELLALPFEELKAKAAALEQAVAARFTT